MIKKIVFISLFSYFLLLNEFITAEEISPVFVDFFLIDSKKEVLEKRSSLEKEFPGDEKKLLDTVLLIRLYQISPEKSYLKEAEKKLEKNIKVTNNDMHIVLSGVVNGYIAKEKKIFGIKNLKYMRSEFNSISEHPHWLVRFLRGMTLYEVSNGLPEIRLLKNQITEGKFLAKRDFYALENTENIPPEIRNAYRERLENLENGL